MRKNRNGFMLVEVIVASTVIITTMITLFTNFQRLFTKYESRTNYHNIDALYATKEMTDYLFENDFNKFINSDFDLYKNESVYIIKGGECEIVNLSSFCNTLKDFYKIETMIFTAYDEKNLRNLQNGFSNGTESNSISITIEAVQNETMKEYIDYIIGYYDITNSNITEDKNPYDYIFLTEIKEEENYYYASLPIR